MTIESITDGHFFIYLLLNIMLKLFKNCKKLKKILLRILGYLLLNFVLIVVFLTMFIIEEWGHGCIGSGFSLYLCATRKVIATNILWYFSGFPINILAVLMAFGFIFIFLTENIFGWSVSSLDDEIYLVSLVGIWFVLLITGIIFWIRYLLRKRKQKSKKSD